MRLSIALALTTLTTAATSLETQAFDCLFGRPAPQVVGYAPYAAGYAPAATTPYVAGYAPSAVTAPVATAPVGSTSVLRPALTSAPIAANGVYQAQRPGYWDNPSVYTGLPVVADTQTLYRVPMTTYRGTAPVISYSGVVNQYPTTYSSAYASAQVGATAPGLPLQVTTPTGAPVTALPATPVVPLYAVPPPRAGVLSRFLSSLFGTNYRTSYYRAPITYYRPITSVDPVSGTTVTVQQPCTSTVQQLQRTPFSSLQTAQGAFVQPGANCSNCQPTPSYGPSPYASTPAMSAPSMSAPGMSAPSNGIGQVGAIGSPGPSTVPIPSIAPSTSGSFNAQPSYPPYTPTPAPLTGAPPFGSSPSGSGDLAPVDQPRIENYPWQEKSANEKEEDSNGSSSDQPGSYWKLQDAEDSTAMIRGSAGQFTGVDPIQAPDDYVSPFRSRFESPVPPTKIDRFEAPPLPERTYDPSEMTSASNRTSVPVRDAALIRTTSRTPPAIKRKTTWYTVQP